MSVFDRGAARSGCSIGLRMPDCAGADGARPLQPRPPPQGQAWRESARARAREHAVSARSRAPGDSCLPGHLRERVRKGGKEGEGRHRSRRLRGDGRAIPAGGGPLAVAPRLELAVRLTKR